jgi:carboxypeptidase Q
MHKLFLLLSFVSLASVLGATPKDSTRIREIVNTILADGHCYKHLEHLTTKIGGRLSGSPEAERAVKFMYEVMQQYNFDTVWLQPVMVPHWVRGEKERAYYVANGKKIQVNVCALGNSVGTDKKGVSAQVIEVRSLEQLHEFGKAGKVKGKIVFFNRPMNPFFIHTGHAYADAGGQRTQGPSIASHYGAVGAVVRSLTHSLDEHPHTGVTIYQDSITPIPACAISAIHAKHLSEALSNGDITFYFRQTCEMLPEKLSYNIIADLRGSEKPNEIVLIGGHLDAWDNGQGAHDDGAGCVQSVEALRVIAMLKERPKRTVRCVLFMNEENGLRGGLKYAEWASQNGEVQLAAIESDAGGFTPRAFNTNAKDERLLKMHNWLPLLRPYGIDYIHHPGGGADISPLAKFGTTLIGFMPDSQRYFDYHHASIDTFDKVNKRELELGAACITALAWLISEYGLD